MKSKQFKKTQIGKTGKGLLNLLGGNPGIPTVAERVAPRVHNEEVLFNYWKNLLANDDFGVTDDFFLVGGNSIKAIQLASFIAREFSVSLQLADIFLQPNIEALVKLVAEKRLLPNDNTIFSKVERPAAIPLSYSQERLWFIDRMEGSLSYHVPAVLRFTGNLNVHALENALQLVIQRQESLRTVFIEQEGNVRQVIAEAGKWQLGIIDGTPYTNDTAGLQNLLTQLVRTPFDLSSDTLLRAHLVQLHQGEALLVVILHHIVADAWSLAILVREVMEAYNAFNNGLTPQLPLMQLQFADFTLWQQQAPDLTCDTNIAYWQSKLEGISPLQLPTDFPRPAIRSTQGDAVEMRIDQQLADQLNQLSQATGTTLFMVLLAAFKVLLYRYSGQQDICVGTSVANRTHPAIEGLIGFFVNTLALRTQLMDDIDFIELLEQVKVTTLEAFAHQDTPFEKIVEVADRQRDASRSPLFQVMLVMPNTPDVSTLQLGEVKVALEPFVHQTAKYDITFFVAVTKDGLLVTAEYNSGLYGSATIVRMLEHFNRLLQSIVENPGQSVAHLPMLGPAERAQLLNQANCSHAKYPLDINIRDLIGAQVAKVPHHIAISEGVTSISYLQLDEQSNRLANYLVKKGMQPQSLVPVCLERSADMVIAMIAILKTGAAYVPIDPSYPMQRIAFMIEDTAARCVVTNSSCSMQLPGDNSVDYIELDTEATLIQKELPMQPSLAIAPGHLAYVIYTSGSTGTPKGVMIEHRNVVQLFTSATSLFDFNEQDVWTVFHSFSFDFSVWEMYGALLFGGRMVIVPSVVAKDSIAFAQLLEKEKVTVLNQTPGAFYVLQEVIKQNRVNIPVRYVIFGGEALNPVKVQPWLELLPGCQLVNMYGITETTVHVTYQPITLLHTTENKSIIGQPIPTLGLYILDAVQQPVPTGVAGELFITGAGLARGYLNRPELTAEKFMVDPFSSIQGARMYRTGDLARWLPDGNIEYMGRIDEQVKIRGYRVELGEIESALHNSRLVNDAVVIAKKDAGGNNQLIAYVVTAMDMDKEALVLYLKGSLPGYMVPALWVQLESIPLTTNGKLNRKVLPDPDGSIIPARLMVAPRNELEEKLVTIWQEILGINSVGIHDNFFEIGGHSLLLMRLVASIKNIFGVTLTIRTFFELETVEELANYIRLSQRSVPSVPEEYENIDI